MVTNCNNTTNDCIWNYRVIFDNILALQNLKPDLQTFYITGTEQDITTRLRTSDRTNTVLTDYNVKCYLLYIDPHQGHGAMVPNKHNGHFK